MTSVFELKVRKRHRDDDIFILPSLGPAPPISPPQPPKRSSKNQFRQPKTKSKPTSKPKPKPKINKEPKVPRSRKPKNVLIQPTVSGNEQGEGQTSLTSEVSINNQPLDGSIVLSSVKIKRSRAKPKNTLNHDSTNEEQIIKRPRQVKARVKKTTPVETLPITVEGPCETSNDILSLLVVSQMMVDSSILPVVNENPELIPSSITVDCDVIATEVTLSTDILPSVPVYISISGPVPVSVPVSESVDESVSGHIPVLTPVNVTKPSGRKPRPPPKPRVKKERPPPKVKPPPKPRVKKERPPPKERKPRQPRKRKVPLDGTNTSQGQTSSQGFGKNLPGPHGTQWKLKFKKRKFRRFEIDGQEIEEEEEILTKTFIDYYAIEKNKVIQYLEKHAIVSAKLKQLKEQIIAGQVPVTTTTTATTTQGQSIKIKSKNKSKSKNKNKNKTKEKIKSKNYDPIPRIITPIIVPEESSNGLLTLAQKLTLKRAIVDCETLLTNLNGTCRFKTIENFISNTQCFLDTHTQAEMTDSELIMEMDSLINPQHCLTKIETIDADICTREGCDGTFVYSPEDAMLYCSRCHLVTRYDDATSSSVAYGDEVEFNSFWYKKAGHLNEWFNHFLARETTQVPTPVLNAVSCVLYHMGLTNVEWVEFFHIQMALKSLRLRVYYHQKMQIFCRILNRAPIRLTPSDEEKIKLMFSLIQDPWKRHLPEGRKNFLSYPYCVYKFCQLLGFNHILPYLSLLKGDEKLEQQEVLFEKICIDLTWPFIPVILPSPVISKMTPSKIKEAAAATAAAIKASGGVGGGGEGYKAQGFTTPTRKSTTDKDNDKDKDKDQTQSEVKYVLKPITPQIRAYILGIMQQELAKLKLQGKNTTTTITTTTTPSVIPTLPLVSTSIAVIPVVDPIHDKISHTQTLEIIQSDTLPQEELSINTTENNIIISVEDTLSLITVR
jgi:hypothetical protein